MELFLFLNLSQLPYLSRSMYIDSLKSKRDFTSNNSAVKRIF